MRMDNQRPDLVMKARREATEAKRTGAPALLAESARRARWMVTEYDWALPLRLEWLTDDFDPSRIVLAIHVLCLRVECVVIGGPVRWPDR